MKYNRTLDYFFNKYLNGHISIGNITIFGYNAMHWGCHIYTKKFGYICFRLPLPEFNYNKAYFRPLYLYFSPNATPWACTFALGKEHCKLDYDFAKAKLRKVYLGHNFDTDKYYGKLKQINNFYPDSKLTRDEYFRLEEEMEDDYY